MFDLPAIQAALHSFQLDGWLLYDFRGLNVLARRVIALPDDLWAEKPVIRGVVAMDAARLTVRVAGRAQPGHQAAAASAIS